MATKIAELFGYSPADSSAAAKQARKKEICPFLGGECIKKIGAKGNRIRSGVCSLLDADETPVIICPIRLYANNYQILGDIAAVAFKTPAELHPGRTAKDAKATAGVARVAVFGKNWGGELRIPNRGKAKGSSKKRAGTYFVDWVLAKLDSSGKLDEFVALEVQSIDTIGSYRDERAAHLAGKPFNGKTAGLNWENVNKRILPQLIFKGHLLQREPRCKSGLFFVCPEAVYHKIMERLGGSLADYPMQAGSLTFFWYKLDPQITGIPRELVASGHSTTSVHQVELAFSAATNLPAGGAYELAIKAALGES